MLLISIAAAVVVELFTSQGCSSCPPADALVSKLVRERGDVIPLAFHVDYWDNALWRDPFSSHQWTERQLMYARTFKLNSTYTPQMVVNGATQFVGSNAAALAHVTHIASIPFDATRNGSNIHANIHAEPPPNSDLMLVVFENGIQTSIGGGENSGRKAIDDAIVRKMWRAKPGLNTVPISPAWKNIGVAVFVQDHATRAITAAAVRYL